MKAPTSKQRENAATARHRDRLNAEKRALRTVLADSGVVEYRIGVTGYRTGGSPYSYASVPLDTLAPTAIDDLCKAGFAVEVVSQYATITPGQIA